MKKLKALTKALKAAGAFKDSDYSAVDQGVLIPTEKNLGYGIEIARIKYATLIRIDNLPDNDAVLLLAFIPAWLSENDTERDSQNLGDAEIDVSLNGDGTSDVELAVDFDEGLQLIPDRSGPITYNGQQWSVAEAPIYVAEGVDKIAKMEELPDA